MITFVATKPYLLAVVGNSRMGKNSTTLDADVIDNNAQEPARSRRR